MPTGGAFALHIHCAETATCDTTNDGVNDPVSAARGSLAGQDTGVVHAIVGSPAATTAPTVTAAQSAASTPRPQQTAAAETVDRHSPSWRDQGRGNVLRACRNRGANLT